MRAYPRRQDLARSLFTKMRAGLPEPSQGGGNELPEVKLPSRDPQRYADGAAENAFSKIFCVCGGASSGADLRGGESVPDTAARSGCQYGVSRIRYPHDPDSYRPEM